MVCRDFILPEFCRPCLLLTHFQFVQLVISCRFGGDPAGELHMPPGQAGRPGEAVADPWYTRGFEAACQTLIPATPDVPDSLCKTMAALECDDLICAVDADFMLDTMPGLFCLT